MAKEAYTQTKFHGATKDVILKAISVCEEYSAQGIVITLRQLYYQFVARDWLRNNDKEYKRLGKIVNDARLAGYIDWQHMQDRTRHLVSLSHWATPNEILNSAGDSYQLDMWDVQYQQCRPIILIEKDAIYGNIERVAQELDVPVLSCRGYLSQTEMYNTAKRLRSYRRQGQTPIIFHFGDHDPSGCDMSRDIQDRLAIFGVSTVPLDDRRAGRCSFERLALNMDQVQLYNPPPNFAKLTDTRATAYIEQYGNESWELDALNPTTLVSLVREFVLSVRDEDGWERASELMEKQRNELRQAADNWDIVTKYLHDRERRLAKQRKS